MSSYKKTAKTVGILILFSTAAYMIGGGLLASVLNHSGFLADLYPNRMKVMAGVILEFMTAAAVVGVPWSVFPVLKQQLWNPY